MNTSVQCPALFLTAPASGQGKTTVTAALARYLRDQGKRVRVFKTGPDYLDPQILEQASGQPVEQLDLWMAGPDYCRQMLFDAASEADFILIEGAMGMFDGEPSSADLAALFGIPMVIVMDVKGMAQTAAAVASGLAHFRSDIRCAGLIANNCASERHRQLIVDALPDDLPLLATLVRDPAISLPERHLGLVQASEVRDELEQRFGHGVQALLAGGIDHATLTHPVSFTSTTLSSGDTHPNELAGHPLEGIRIGIARDAAFSFIYSANLRQLTALGAQYAFFSPLQDQTLADFDALWLPGGYPELHAAALAANQPMKTAIQQFFQQDKPVLAECGGMLYCLETLTDLDQQTFPMLGLLNGQGMMRGKRGCQGMQTAVLPEGDIRGHAHHRSRSEGTPEPISYGRRQRHPAPGEAIYRHRGLTASYLHLFFPSNPVATAQLFLPSDRRFRQESHHVD
ncbi:cobyrinate a,c-diamide synthase [Gynuella sunshinyii]|uniref:Cobyrinic acid a,c-diamide synthase n=1 Tax=Gynuella sunshinyii YC6258 TaxID=1445510 RepID=A0A0C5VPH3_9GAMM|nr:cobyrinate a,c-diamide synthase [Gynuella sunshinyii]AJQ92164.1 cobyrinic acid a,c-diamide synthase [Gynuella sunshinyii YC6258]